MINNRHKKVTNDNIGNSIRISENILKTILSDNQESTQNEFQNILNNNELTENLKAKLSDVEHQKYVHKKFLTYDKGKELEKFSILLKKNNTKNKIKVKLYTYSIITVAAAVLFVSFMIWSQENRVDSDKKTVAEMNFDKPTLIKSSGENINLDFDNVITNKQDNIENITDKTISYNKQAEPEVSGYNELIVPAKHTFSIILSDGSEVTLNANSRLKYSIILGEDERVVELEGEGFFKIAKSDVPFKVKMRDETVTVYGTEFNIKNRQFEETSLVLKQGSVGYRFGDEKEVKLNPGERLTKDYNSNEIEVKEVDIEAHLSWMSERFVFKDMSLNSILRDVSNWYGVKIDVPNYTDDRNFTFIINKDTDIDEVLNQISYMSNSIIKKLEKGVYELRER